MEELYEELQRCYGSVRYRRSLENATAFPIPLQKVKRPGTGPFSEPIARVTPPGSMEVRNEATAGGGPILLTRRKERRKTLPMEPLPVDAATPLTTNGATTPPEAVPAAQTHDEWSEPTLRASPEDWHHLEHDLDEDSDGDLDIDGSGGTSN